MSKRPCPHPQGPPGAGCAVCWRWATDPRFRALWGDDPAWPPPSPGAYPYPAPWAAPAAARTDRSKPCRHLGPATGALRDCGPT